MSGSGYHPSSVTIKQNSSVVLAIPTSPTPPDDVERTATGIPIRLIWLPYVGLTLLLLAMMCLSFVHYHRKNGHKYRRRREELLKQFGDGVTVETPANGGFTISPEQPVNPFHHRPPKQNPHFQPSSSSIESQLYTVRSKKSDEDSKQALNRQNSSSIFRQISAPQSSSSKQPAYSPRGVPLVTPKPQPQSAPPTYPPPQYPPQPLYSKHGRAADSGSHARRHKRPLVFTTNLNGSMVDIRCGVKESHRTFKPKSSRSTSLPTTSIWTLPHLSARAQQHRHSGMKGAYAEQEFEDYPREAGGPYSPGGAGPGYMQGSGGPYSPGSGRGGSTYPPGGTTYSPTGGGPYSPTALPNITSDCEDDDVFLLHQTKL